MDYFRSFGDEQTHSDVLAKPNRGPGGRSLSVDYRLRSRFAPGRAKKLDAGRQLP